MNHFVNDPAAAVTDALDGVVRAAGAGHLQRLDGSGDIKVIVAAGLPGPGVAVVAGGGAGHEPAHAGFVGPGLLGAAISGEIFASPSVEAVLAGILAVTGPAGCLLVVKSYTGDRLNFGLAAERAKGLGLRVATVVVGDDIALPDAGQPRGLAGTLLVHKVAGALAVEGAALEEVHAGAAGAADAVRTFAVSLSGADIPGRAAPRRLAEGQAELGLGIHGEPGAETVTAGRSAELVGRVVERLEAALPGDGPVALLVNNLGGLSTLEMHVVVRDVLDSALGGRAELLVGPAPLMTSLAMRGISVSAMALDDTRRRALLAPVASWTAWPGARQLAPPGRRSLSAGLGHAALAASAHAGNRRILATVCQAVIAERDVLDALDAAVGDGDTGSTFATAAGRILDELDTLPLAEPSSLLRRLSELLASAMGGSSGVLLSILLAAAAGAVEAGAGFGEALAAGTAAVGRYGGAAEGDRTMLDALGPAVRALGAGAALADAARAAEEGAARTAAMTRARAGRSAYVGSVHLAGVVDPGARAVSVVLAALAGG